MSNLIEQLIRHEGMRLKPYYCTAGKLTIGVGRNLDDVGISEQEAKIMLLNDIARCKSDCLRNLPFFIKLSETRQDVLINMCFNMGINGLLKFKNTLKAIEEGRFKDAAQGMLDSLWAKQVKSRAEELSELMEKV